MFESDRAVNYLTDRIAVMTKLEASELHRAIVDLLINDDIPLDGSPARQWIADSFYRLAFPDAKRDRKIKTSAQLSVADFFRPMLIEKGHTKGEADEIIASKFNITSSQLRRRRSEAKK